MKAYLPFGDWSEDGHRYCDKVLVSINSIEEVGKAQDAIREKYGADLFEGWAQDNSRLSEECWNALLNEGLPIDYLIEFDDTNDWSSVSSYDEVFQADTEPLLSLEFVAHAFIWLLNKFGANMIVLTEDDDIPVRNYLYNASCEGYFDPMEVLAANHRYCQEHKAGFNTLTKDYIERHFKEFEV